VHTKVHIDIFSANKVSKKFYTRHGRLSQTNVISTDASNADNYRPNAAKLATCSTSEDRQQWMVCHV